MGGGCQVQLHNASNNSESKWPSLPTYILWIIKDKLDIFDDMCLTVACRDWWLASESYSSKKTLGNGTPCLMQTSLEASTKAKTCKRARSNSCEFISVAKKKYTLNLPELQGCRILHSKEGWLLMRRKASKSTKDMDIFFMNPARKVKIQLPSVTPSRYGCRCVVGTFSIRDGHPDRVFLIVKSYDEYPIATIKTAYPGDQVWTDHTCTDTAALEEDPFIYRLITAGEHVYCYLFATREMLMYNMNTQIWKKAPPSPPLSENYQQHRYVTEFEGHVVEVRKNKCRSEFSFFRYNEGTTLWEKLTSDDLNDTCWFIAERVLYPGLFCFGTRRKEGGKKVYHVCTDERLLVLDTFCKSAIRRNRFRVVCYDLMDGSKEIIKLPFHVSFESTWVDI